jgi:hypothetical protein
MEYCVYKVKRKDGGAFAYSHLLERTDHVGQPYGFDTFDNKWVRINRSVLKNTNLNIKPCSSQVLGRRPFDIEIPPTKRKHYT